MDGFKRGTLGMDFRDIEQKVHDYRLQTEPEYLERFLISVQKRLEAPKLAARIADPPPPPPLWQYAAISAAQLFGFALMFAGLVSLF